MLLLKRLNGKEIRVFFILSIVVPIGLLTALRLTGFVAGPLEPESFTVRTVEWIQERPVGYVRINDTVQNIYRDGNLSAAFNITVEDYGVSSLFGGSDLVSLTVIGTASVPDGSVEMARVVFREDFEPSEVRFWFLHFDSTLRNLSFSDYAATDLSESKLTDDTKAFVTFVGENTPSNVYFRFMALWVLRSPSNQSHSLKVALELTYRAGQAYERVILPVKLDLLIDDNNSFETATEIQDGNYTRLYIGGTDVHDYYKVYRVEGQRIQVSADSSAWLREAVPFFTLYLCDPQQNPTAAANQYPKYVQNLEFIANSTGYWYIEVRNDGSGGFYSLGVSQ